MVDMTQRHTFAAFLDRLAAGTLADDDWAEYAVNHYPDETLEECRRNCVQLAIEAGEPFPRTDTDRAWLHAWANDLRATIA